MPLMAHTGTMAPMTRDALAQILPPESTDRTQIILRLNCTEALSDSCLLQNGVFILKAHSAGYPYHRPFASRQLVASNENRDHKEEQ